MIQTALRSDIFLLSFELSNNKWLLTFSNGQRIRRREIAARDLSALDAEIVRTRAKLNTSAPLQSCYEAGRDGFWLHRALTARGVMNLVIDPSSIEVNRRKRRAKNDSLDGEALLRLLARYASGERRHFRVVRVPDEAAEDARRPQRELDRLTKERTALINRIRSLLALEGLVLKIGVGFLETLENARRWDGAPLSPHLVTDIRHAHERMELLGRQIKALRKEQDDHVKKAPQLAANKKVAGLRRLNGINRSAYTLVSEFFGWREFSNRREVGAAAGLVGTPYESGDRSREQGISKAGSARIRTLMVEIAWSWLRYQPGSELSQWFARRFSGGGRMRRIGIVALARKLLVALWRFVEQGVVPAGAVMKSAT